MIRPRVLVPAVALVGAVAWVLAQGMGDSLVYYRTPSEAAGTPAGERVRLGGRISPGSVAGEGRLVRFVLTDEKAEVRVVLDGTLPVTFREGQGAVVEGAFDAGRTLRADTVLVKHGNRYSPPTGDRG